MRAKGWASIFFSRLLHIAVLAAVLGVVGVKVAHRWMNASNGGPAAIEESEFEDTSKLRRQAEQAFESEDWPELVSASRKLVRLTPDDSFGWVRLAYGLHQTDQLRDALAAYSRCSDFDQVRPWALYNMAAIYARLGDAPRAIDHLRSCLKTGWRPQRSVTSDPDFRSLLSNSDFLAVADLAQPLGAKSVNEQLSFLAGKWSVLDANDNLLGEADFESTAGGFAWRGTYVGDDGEVSTLMYFFDPADQEWTRIRVDESGTVERTHGKLDAGSRRSSRLGRLLLWGERVEVGGLRRKVRIRIVPQSLDRLLEIVEISSDDGETWVTDWTATYSRPTAFSLERTSELTSKSD